MYVVRKLIVATGDAPGSQVTEVYPVPKSLAQEIPEKPRKFLEQANQSLHAPSGAIMLCSSAVDAMLKLLGYKDGSLYTRIDKAVTDNLLTKEMGQWAHHIRLEANDEHHADETADLPTMPEAEQSIEFTEALADILFVLPSRVKRGIKRAQVSATSNSSARIGPRYLDSEGKELT
jgi:hypothetical protein